jgi:ribose transport system permease protein
MYFLLRKTVLGRWVYATGSNEEASRLVGIPVDRVKIICYTVSGFLSSVAALLGASRLMNVEVTSGVGMELDAIAAACIGGASLSGGLGTAFGALIGTLLQKGINNGINLLGINSFWSGAVTGVVIIVSVYVGMQAGKNKKTIIKK